MKKRNQPKRKKTAGTAIFAGGFREDAEGNVTGSQRSEPERPNQAGRQVPSSGDLNAAFGISFPKRELGSKRD